MAGIGLAHREGAANVSILERGGKTSSIRCAAFSPDGALLALGSHDRTASLVDSRTGERVRHLQGLHTNSIFCAAFSPNGALLALGSGDRTASLVDPRTGERVRHLQGLHTSSIYYAAFSPDGALLAHGLGDGTASLVDPRTGERVRHLKDLHTGPIYYAAFSPDSGAPAEGVPPTAAAAAAQRAVVERRLQDVAQRRADLPRRHAEDKAALLAAHERVVQELLDAQEQARQQQEAEQANQLRALEAELEALERQHAALEAYLPPPPDSPVSGRSLATSEFKKAYGQAAVPEGAMDLGIALGDMLRGYCKALGVDWGSEGAPFLRRLQQEALYNAADPIDQLMQRMWTSAEQLRGREFCFIFNDALRDDVAALAPSVAALARGVNTMCVSVPPRGPFPPGDVCYRGGGFDDRYRDFFVPRRHFRIPNYFATSFSADTADAFLRRSPMPSKVRWVVRVDPEQHCVHVNLVTKRVPGLPDEQEYLFAPYSAFTVRSVQWKVGSDADPHVIELEAAVDNKAEPEDLPLAPWS